MKVKIPFTWRDAFSNRFNKDKVRREGTRFTLRKKMKVYVDRDYDHSPKEIQQWLEDNEVKNYKMSGVFIVHPDNVYFAGLAFEFECEDTLIHFKLSFSA